MSTDRFGHGSVLLPDGRVLILGGYHREEPPTPPKELDTAEVFDPATGTFRTVGTMQRSHAEVFAFLLGSGRVAIASRFARQLELFDLGTEMFSVAGGELSEIYEAAELSLTKVFLHGFSCRICEPRHAYVYDAVTGRTVTYHGLEPNRGYATATTLRDGRVLIAGGEAVHLLDGGFVEYENLATAYLFDPSTGVMQPTGSLATRRAYHSATLLSDGKVLVAGGAGGPECTRQQRRCGMLSSSEIYDPATGEFTPTSSLNIATFDHTATLLPDGRVLFAGGDISDGVPTDRTEIYDPVTRSFRRGQRLNEKRMNHRASLLLSGDVLLTGGITINGAQTRRGLRSAELYRLDVPCTFAATLSNAAPFGVAGGSGTIEVETTAGCAWASRSEFEWLEIDPHSKTGSASARLKFSVKSNSGAARRSRVTIGGATVFVEQDGAPLRRRAARH